MLYLTRLPLETRLPWHHRRRQPLLAGSARRHGGSSSRGSLGVCGSSCPPLPCAPQDLAEDPEGTSLPTPAALGRAIGITHINILRRKVGKSAMWLNRAFQKTVCKHTQHQKLVRSKQQHVVGTSEVRKCSYLPGEMRISRTDSLLPGTAVGPALSSLCLSLRLLVSSLQFVPEPRACFQPTSLGAVPEEGSGLVRSRGLLAGCRRSAEILKLKGKLLRTKPGYILCPELHPTCLEVKQTNKNQCSKASSCLWYKCCEGSGAGVIAQARKPPQQAGGLKVQLTKTRGKQVGRRNTI